MKKKVSLILIAFVIVCLLACNKKTENANVEENTAISKAEDSSIKSWLTSQIVFSKDSLSFRQIIFNLDWDKTDKIHYPSNGTLVTIPIRQDITLLQYARIIKVDGHTTNYLVVLLDSVGNVQQGSIGKLLSEKSTITFHPSKIISEVLTNSSESFTGEFTMMTLDRLFLFQYIYEDNKRYCQRVMQALSKAESSQLKTNGRLDIDEMTAKASGKGDIVIQAIHCIEWYLVTTYGDGTEIWSYLDTTCEDNCQSTSIKPDGKLGQVKINCAGGNEGGYLGGVGDEPQGTRTAWVSIECNADIPYDPYFAIKANCTAVRENGAIFQATMHGSYIPYPNTRPNYSYLETDKINEHTSTTATFGFIGDVYAGPAESYHVSRRQIFTSAQLFP